MLLYVILAPKIAKTSEFQVHLKDENKRRFAGLGEMG
jgi:hypothetical protein